MARFTYIDDSKMRVDANALTAARLLFASMVIWTHSYWRLSGVEEIDDFSGILGAPLSELAVDGFFFISGFLVYASLLRTSTLGKFAIKRFVRLWPGLAVCVALTIAVGAFVTSASLQDYLLGRDTVQFFIYNLSLLTRGFYLTGINCGAEPCIINGSLWTISWEVRSYAVLGILGLLGLSSPRFLARVVIPLSLIFAVLVHFPVFENSVKAVIGEGLYYNIATFDRLWTIFILGSAAFIARDRLPVSWVIWSVLLIIMLITAQTVQIPHFSAIFAGYTVLCIGFAPGWNMRLKGDWPDYSYGVYIYAFPVMMALAAIYPFTRHGWLAAATFAVSLPLAAMSWHFIEKPSLSAYRNRSRQKNISSPEAV